MFLGFYHVVFWDQYLFIIPGRNQYFFKVIINQLLIVCALCLGITKWRENKLYLFCIFRGSTEGTILEADLINRCNKVNKTDAFI